MDEAHEPEDACPTCGAHGRMECSTASGRDHKARWKPPVLREYEVSSTYKVTGTAYVMAPSAQEAVEIGLNAAAPDAPEFVFSDPHSETKMRAHLVRRPAKEQDQ